MVRIGEERLKRSSWIAGVERELLRCAQAYRVHFLLSGSTDENLPRTADSEVKREAEYIVLIGELISRI